jgi:hypothetical protein
MRIKVSMLDVRKIISKALPEKTLVQGLAMTGSPALGYTAGWISAAGSAGNTSPASLLAVRVLLRSDTSGKPGRKCETQ